jgi:hypothetical protein
MIGTTPAALSLELGVDQKRIREFLRERYGKLPTGTFWNLDDVQAESVRTRFSGPDPLSGTKMWTLEIGDTVRRRAIHDAYGGQRQGGISTPVSIPDIIVITSQQSGSRHGYDAFEGLQEDGSFAYTGEGQYGRQEFVRGNAAIRDSARDGRPLRLFTKHGVTVTYVGEFTTGDPAYRLETIPDSNGDPREGIIFNLVPVEGDIEALNTASKGLRSASHVSTWNPPEWNSYALGQSLLLGEREVSRIEFKLQGDFGEWVRARGETPRRLRLESAGTTIEPDIYVDESGWVVEAKKSPARAYVRTAIGQVLDYARVARESGHKAVPVILLPSRPVPHMIDLIFELGIILIVRDGDGFIILG